MTEIVPVGQLTISEGIGWIKTLRERRTELIALRNDNATRDRRFYGANADKEIVKEPVYDVRKLDAQIAVLAATERKLDAAIKHANATVPLMGFALDEAVLGNVELMAPDKK